MDANIPYITRGQKDRYAELDGMWQPLKGRMNALLDKEVGGFNALCAQKKLEKVIVPEK
jgi:hypothetical protein